MRLSILSAFALLPILLYTQATIEVIILPGDDSTEIVTYIPSMGDFEGVQYRTPKVNLKQGVAEINIDIDKPGIVRLEGPFEASASGNWVRLYVEPGGKYTVISDTHQGKQKLVFNGKHAELNTLLNRKRRADARYPSNQFLIEPYLDTDDPTEVVRLLEIAKLEELNAISSIKKISKEAIAYLTADVELYHLSLLSGVMSIKAFNYGHGKITMLEPWKSVAKVQFSQSRTSIYDRASPWLPRYVEGKRSTLTYLQEEVIEEKFGNKDVYDIRWPLTKILLFDSDLEVGLAHLLFLEIHRNPSLTITRTEYKNFVEKYPESFYEPALSRLAIETWGEGVSPRRQVINLLEKQKFTSFKAALNAGSHDLVYVDIWATWCGPCKKGFLNKKKLEDFQETHAGRLGLLYVSIDETSRGEDEIQEAIDFYNLRGRVIRASEKLRKQLYETFGENNTLSIPRYLIMSRSGRVLNMNAAPPNQWPLLRSQLQDAMR